MASLKRISLLLLLSSLLLLLVSVPFAAGSEAVIDDEVGGAADGGEVGLVDEEVDEFFSGDSLGSAPGVETVFHFPKNTEKMITAGESAEIIVGLRNSEELPEAFSSELEE